MSFKFNMQRALDYREQMEEDARARLAKANHSLHEGEEKFKVLQNLLNDAETNASGKIMRSAERWLHEQYIKGLRSDVHEAALQVQMLKQMVEEARKYLEGRAIDRKILEKLKEKKKIQYIKAEQKQEQIFNDEIATVRYKTQAL